MEWGMATAAIFTTCAIHHGQHAAHLVRLAPGGVPAELDAVRRASRADALPVATCEGSSSVAG